MMMMLMVLMMLLMLMVKKNDVHFWHILTSYHHRNIVSPLIFIYLEAALQRHGCPPAEWLVSLLWTSTWWWLSVCRQSRGCTYFVALLRMW
jgi:hypothetical protein